MPGGTWLGLETSRRGIKVHQNALDITGHNLANASTPGYSRQEVVIAASSPYFSPDINSSCTPGQFGTGAEAAMIRRIKDEYLDNNVIMATTDNAYWEEQISSLQQAEAVFLEPTSDGIGQRLVDFFKSWMDLNNTPKDNGIKNTVTQLGTELASLMRTTYKQLADINEGIANISSTTVGDSQMKNSVDRANYVITEISELTQTINKIYSAGQQPNDLLDQRDQLIEELSQYGPVTVNYEYTNGKPTGKFAATNGITFFGVDLTTGVNSNTPENFSLSVDSNSHILLNDGAGNLVVDLTDSCKTNQKGSLLGLENARKSIADYMNMLDNIAVDLRDQVNTILNMDFFVDKSSLKDGNFDVDPALLNDPSPIDGSKAFQVSQLAKNHIISSDCTYEEYFSLIITKVGDEAKGVYDLAANQKAIKSQFTTIRDSVSGVNTEEELTKMMQFQYGFQSSARMITTIDGMLDVIINQMGRG